MEKYIEGFDLADQLTKLKKLKNYCIFEQKLCRFAENESGNENGLDYISCVCNCPSDDEMPCIK